MSKTIYKKLEPTNIEQGDVFQNLPKINYQAYSDQLSQWSNQFKPDNTDIKKIKFQVMPTKANGVLLSQTCDARPGNILIFGEISDNIPNNRQVPPLSDHISKNSMDLRIKNIKKIIRDDTRYHYMPEGSNTELFAEPKILNFLDLFFVPFDHVIKNLDVYFHIRLIDEAVVVLKEKISKFFSRLAFEDNMFLTNDDLKFKIQNSKTPIETKAEINSFFKEIDRKLID